MTVTMRTDRISVPGVMKYTQYELLTACLLYFLEFGLAQKTSFFDAIFVPAAPRRPQIIKPLSFDSNLNMILYILSPSYFWA